MRRPALTTVVIVAIAAVLVVRAARPHGTAGNLVGDDVVVYELLALPHPEFRRWCDDLGGTLPAPT